MRADIIVLPEPLIDNDLGLFCGGEPLGLGLRERHEAEFVDDQKVNQLLLQAQQAFFLPGRFMNQGSGREEADGEPLLAGRQTETEGDMGLAGS